MHAKVRLRQVEGDLHVAMELLQHWKDMHAQKVRELASLRRHLYLEAPGLIEDALLEQSKLLADMGDELAWSAITGE